jgi:hypothetical protein
LVIAPYIYSGSSSKVKQGGCTRKGYAVRFPMLRIDRDAKRRTLAVLTHSLIFSEEANAVSPMKWKRNQSWTTSTPSISTNAPRGNAATPTAARAG